MKLFGVAIVVVVASLDCAACSEPRQAATSHGVPNTPARVTPTTNRTTTIPTTTTSTLPAFGARSFTVSGAVLSGGNWLTVGLHPTTTPVRVQASASAALEVCPAGLDGGLNDSSWPPWFKFPTCVSLPKSGTMLPATDGGTHVAFALKAASASASFVNLVLTVSYIATDSFVEVIPPTTSSHAYLTVTYTPRSTTTGAEATPVNSLTSAPGYSLDVMQGGRTLSESVPCDFPTELTTCLGGVVPGIRVEAQLVGQGSTVVLSLAWK
jgi:hypothetical protein